MAEVASTCPSRPSGTEIAEALCEAMLIPEFFDKHWEKWPLHFRAAEHGREANRLPEALSVDDVFALIGASASNLKMFKQGVPYVGDNFVTAYLDGASLIVNQADRCNETLCRLSRRLGERHFFHTFAVLYLTPPGSQAVRLHCDDQDVFLLQVWGRKRWVIRNAPQLLPYTEEMLGKDAPVPASLVGEPILEFTMEPYDVLYIPRGFLHEAATREESSLHVTLTVPTSDYCWGVQLVKHFTKKCVSRELPHQDICRASLCASGGDVANEAALDKSLKDLLAAWREVLTADHVIDDFEQRMARTNEGRDYHFARNAEIEHGPRVLESTRVRLMHGIHCECEADGDHAIFTRTNDSQRLQLPIANSASHLIRSLTHRPQWVRDLPCSDAFERICVLQLLHQQQIVQLFLKGPHERSSDASPEALATG